MRPYDIPYDIRNLESGTDKKKMQSLEEMVGLARSDEESYLSLRTSMVYLEEANESSHLSKYNLENVRLTLHSQKDKVFRIEYDVSYIILLKTPNTCMYINESLSFLFETDN